MTSRRPSWRTAALAGAAGATVAALLAGCAGWTTAPALTLRVDSRIDRPLLVYVNGDWVGTIPADTADATVPASGHGGPPWTAEGRVANGTVLITLPIPAAPASGEGITTTAVTACGTITMAVGAPEPDPALAPPAPGAELPPCD